MRKIGVAFIFLLLGFSGFIFSSENPDSFAYFIDCSGKYIKINVNSVKIIASGNLTDIEGTGMLKGVRDGILIHDISYSPTDHLLTVFSQTEVWGDEDGMVYTKPIRFEIPSFKFVPVATNDATTDISSTQFLSSTAQKSFLQQMKGKPFRHKIVLWSPNGEYAILLENEERSDAPDAFELNWKMAVGGYQWKVNKKFAVYRISDRKLVAQYQIHNLQTDLKHKTLMTDDAHLIFHCTNDEAGERGLYAVKTYPKTSIVKMNISDFDSWYSVGFFADR